MDDRIAGLNESDFGQDRRAGGQVYWEWSDYGKNTTLFLMMTYGKYMRLPKSEKAQKQYFDVGFDIWKNFQDHFELVYYSKGSPVNGAYYALILIYKVKY